MATIAIMVDIEEGHLFPTFGLAGALREAGHTILYLSIPDNAEFVKREGFAFYPVFEKYYPRGFRARYKETNGPSGHKYRDSVRVHMDELISGSFGELLREIGPDVLIISCFLNIEALILFYSLRIEPVILRPFLREKGVDIMSECTQDIMNLAGDAAMKLFDFAAGLGLRFTSFADLVKPLKNFPELVLCSKAFELGEPVTSEKIFYIGSDIGRRVGNGEVLPGIRTFGGRKVIYASLGSQTITYQAAFELFFRKMVGIMEMDGMKNMHLVIAIGVENDASRFSAVSENITVVKWISQLDILGIASVAVIHGGLGAIKECIHHGVPMVVLPIMRDQPANARRVVYHQLGVALDINCVQEQDLAGHIQQVLNSEAIRENLANMKQRFALLDEENLGVAIIERIIAERAGVSLPSWSGR